MAILSLQSDMPICLPSRLPIGYGEFSYVKFFIFTSLNIIY